MTAKVEVEHGDPVGVDVQIVEAHGGFWAGATMHAQGESIILPPHGPYETSEKAAEEMEKVLMAWAAMLGFEYVGHFPGGFQQNKC